MFIPRDPRRTEHDDFQINVCHHLGTLSSNIPLEAVPQYAVDGDGELVLIGWEIQPQYE